MFASPIWLLGLIPWTAAAICLLQGRRRRMEVPFLDLWPRDAAMPQSRRSWRLPPHTAAVLAAALLAIVAAAAPRIGSQGVRRPIIVILDRGISMSARQGAQRRFQSLAAAAAPAIARILGPGTLQLLLIPGGQKRIVDRADWAEHLVLADPTAVDTAAALTAAARYALLDSQAIVILLSDRKIALDDPRLVQITPERGITNIGIADLAVRAAPSPQAMVRLINDSPALGATLRVTGDADRVSVDLPPRGQWKNCFVDLTSAPDLVEASVRPGGDIDADDRAWAVRARAWPRLESAGPLAPELQRMIDVYRADRPAGNDSSTVVIASSESSAPAVLLNDCTLPPAGPAQWTPGPITDGLDWNTALNQARLTARQPDATWQRLVWIGDHVLLAIRQQPARQVWIGFRSTAWAATPDFVLFWSNVFNWVGQGQDRYIHSTVGGSDLWPGVYRRDGRRLAVNAPPIHLDPPAADDWQAHLSRLAAEQPIGPSDASCWVLVGAIACLLAAAVA
jgi:hypothetical protein